MDTDSGIKMRFGGTSLHGNGNALHNFTGITADHWEANGPTAKQFKFAAWKQIDVSWCKSPSDASLAISARMNATEFAGKMERLIWSAGSDEALTNAGKILKRCGRSLD